MYLEEQSGEQQNQSSRLTLSKMGGGGVYPTEIFISLEISQVFMETTHSLDITGNPPVSSVGNFLSFYLVPRLLSSGINHLNLFEVIKFVFFVSFRNEHP